MTTRPAAHRLYRLLLHAYPAAYRRRFGGAMLETFASDHARVREHGAPAAAGFWIMTLAQAAVFGTGERLRAFRGGRMLPRIYVRDLVRSSLRQFRHQPLYAFACAITLALGVAGATASLAVTKGALFDPLPYRDGDQLVSLFTRVASRDSAVSPHVVADLREAASPLSEFAPVRPMALTYAASEGTESISANAVTPEYFSVLGVQPAIGRSWSADEQESVVLSWEFWQRAFGGDARALGRTVTLDGRARTVVGVMPPNFLPPYFVTASAWLPLDMATLMRDPRGRRSLTVIARRANGVSQAELDAYFTVFSASQRERFPVIHGAQSFVAIPLRAELVGASRPALLGTLAAAVLLLLIVCANIAGLSTARAVSVRHQSAIRAALGASRGRLFLERLSDSLVISLVGSAGGVWLGSNLVALAARYQQQFLERMAPLSLDLPTASIGLAAGLVAGMAAALVPLSTFGTARATNSLRGARTIAGNATGTSMRSALVAVQVALALVLLVGAGLLVRTVAHLSTMSLGFRAERLTTFFVGLPGTRYRTEAQQRQFERDVIAELQRLPGVVSASASVGIPVFGGMGASLSIKGRPDDAGLAEIAYLSVSPEFIAAYEVRLKAGRNLTFADDGKAPPVMLVNDTMARTYWPKGDALGAQIYIGSGAPPADLDEWMTVVGITEDLRLHGPTMPIRAAAFGSTLQFSWPRRHFTVRMDSDTSPVPEIRAVVGALDPSLAVTQISSIDAMASERTARHRLVMLALGFFGTVALILCAFGLYAVVALTAALRRREYAIRIALGGASGAVRWMVLRQALRLSTAGAAAGLLCAAAGTRTLQGLLLGVTPLDPSTFALATVAVLGLAAAAAWIPARHAAAVDPVEALKAE